MCLGGGGSSPAPQQQKPPFPKELSDEQKSVGKEMGRKANENSERRRQQTALGVQDNQFTDSSGTPLGKIK